MSANNTDQFAHALPLHYAVRNDLATRYPECDAEGLDALMDQIRIVDTVDSDREESELRDRLTRNLDAAWHRTMIAGIEQPEDAPESPEGADDPVADDGDAPAVVRFRRGFTWDNCAGRNVGYAQTAGDCLAPWIHDFDRVVFDFDLDPVDGDFVMLYAPATKFSEAYLGLKMLREYRGRHYLLSRQSPLPLTEACKLVGTLVATVHYCRKPARPLYLSAALDEADARAAEVGIGGADYLAWVFAEYPETPFASIAAARRGYRLIADASGNLTVYPR